MMRLSLSLSVLVTNEVVLSESEEDLLAFRPKTSGILPKTLLSLGWAGAQVLPRV